MITIVALLLLLALTSLSLWLRVARHRNSLEEVTPKASPLALAVQELVATAGGLYLSIVMLISFLKIDLPGKVTLYTIALDPLALLSMGLAIIQPFFFRLMNK